MAKEPVLSASEAPDSRVAEAALETVVEPVVPETPVTTQPAVEILEATAGLDNDSAAVPVSVAETEVEPDDLPLQPAPETPEPVQEIAVAVAEPPEGAAEETTVAVAEDVEDIPEQGGQPVGQTPAADAPVEESAPDTPAQEVTPEPVEALWSGAPVPEPTTPSPPTGGGEIEAVTDSEPHTAVGGQAVCVRVGPLESADADQVIAALPASVTLLSDVSEDYQRVDRYYVLIPPLPSRSAGRQKLKELADAGVTDTWLFPSGENRNAISLGFFSRERRAQRHAANIAKMGFDTEVQGKASTRTGRWLVLQAAGDIDPALSLALPAQAGVEPQACP